MRGGGRFLYPAMSWISRLWGRPPAPAVRPSCLVVGLGNPGPDYVGTRHNVGFEVVDRLAHRLGLAMDAEAGFSMVGEGVAPPEGADRRPGADGRPVPEGAPAGDPGGGDRQPDPPDGAPLAVALAKPLTFMNRSGRAVTALLDRYGLEPDRMLVVYDDLALPVGALRLRGKGSHGGHNGVRDVIAALGSSEFPRLRVGVGNSFPPGGQVSFVLAPFDDDERPAADAAVADAADAALAFARSGLAAAMNQYNRR